MRSLTRIVLAVLGLAVVAAAIGYLTLRRPDIPYATLEQKYANQASRFLDLPNGVRVHYRDQGNPAGPPIVLVHGFSASLETWEPWVQRLGAAYRIITLDLPGHGLTQAPANYHASIQGYAGIVDQVTNRLHLAHFTLGGNSMGGAVTWVYTLAHPEKVDAMLLIDSAGWPHDGHGSPLVFQLLNNALIGPLLRELDSRALIADGLRAAFVNKALVTDAMVDRYWDLARAPGHRAIITNIEQNGGDPAQTSLLSTPTLIMHGDGDALIPPADSRRFADTIVNATLVELPDVGHAPMEEAPDPSAAAVATFLARVYAAPATPSP